MDKFLNHLGPIKNPLLAFVLGIVIVLLHFGSDISKDQHSRVHGLFIIYIAVFMAAATLVFYMYALVKLPPTRLAVAFAQDAKKMVKQHERKRIQQLKDHD